MTSNSFSRYAALCLYGVLAFGVFLRLYGLDHQSLWLDEFATLGPALHAHSFADAYTNYVNLHPTPPLYTLFIIGWSAVFGYDEWVLRLPSALLGCATVYVFWRSLRKVLDADVADSAAILMALSWPAVYYSQELRAYEAALFFVTIGAGLWLSILKDISGGEDHPATWYWMFVTALFASATHPFGFIISGFLLLYLFVIGFGMNRQTLRAFGLGATLAVFYGAWLVPNLIGIAHVTVSTQTVFDRPGLEFFVSIGAFLFHHPVTALLTCVIPLALGGRGYIADLRSAVTRRAWSDPVIALPCMMTVPFAFVFTVAQFQPFMYSRHMIAFLPFIYAFYAVVMARHAWKPGLQPIVVAALAIAASYWVYSDYYQPEKAQNREAVALAIEQCEGNCTIAVGCRRSPPFECREGPNARTDGAYTRYLYYLNRTTLPMLPYQPQVFHNETELTALIKAHQSNGEAPIVFLGGREGFRFIKMGAAAVRRLGGQCKRTDFLNAWTEFCHLSPEVKGLKTSE